MIPQISIAELRAAFGFPPEYAADSVLDEAIAWARERLAALIQNVPDPLIWQPRLALAARLMAGAQVLRLTATAAAAGPRHLVLAGQRVATDPTTATALADAIDHAAHALIASLCSPPDPLALLTDPKPIA